MHCSYVHGDADQLVTLRNFSGSGLYFESTWDLRPGALVVLRSMDAAETASADSRQRRPRYRVNANEPEACSVFRSHTVATVQRCVKLDRGSDAPLYGVGVEVQYLSDY